MSPSLIGNTARRRKNWFYTRRRLLPRAEENLQTVRAAYGFGEFSVFEVVAEQRRLNENVTGYNQTLRDYYTALRSSKRLSASRFRRTAFAVIRLRFCRTKILRPKQIDKEKFLKSLFEKDGIG